MNMRVWATAVIVAAGVVGVATPAQAAPRQVPCTRSGGLSYCNFWVPGNGFTGGSPVVDGPVVGYLPQGRNWIVCQERGPEASLPGYPQWKNDWYGWTTAENGRRGWVNAVAASGGDNFGSFANTPNCNGEHGSPF